MLFFARVILGFGKGCIQSTSTAIIGFNYPAKMPQLFGLWNLATQIGMSLGGLYGSEMEKLTNYVWVFNVNSIMLFILIIYTIIVLPGDAPAPAAAAIAGGASDITMMTLLKRYNQLSVAATLSGVLFTYCQYESIISISLTEYNGVSKTMVSLASAGQGVGFIIASISLGMMPIAKKNFNKTLLAGSFVIVLANLITGPIKGISVADPSSRAGYWWTVVGLILGGIGGAMILPYGMPALAENLVGVFPADKAREVKNAQGVLVSTFFGAGNLIGTLLGGLTSQVFFPNVKCLEFNWDYLKTNKEFM